MTYVSVTEARKRLYSLVDEARESHQPVHIGGKRGGAVLVSDDDWASIQETLYLLSIPGMRESIRKGMETPLDKCSKDLKW
ncbi:MAG: type II toxin-antitoxin system prevent-host-death family antitoxin [Chitinivibrionales bacterium]|nr:type II toxin-antitoxin system prevent-host-death family antitoxin [Chitinivibrionales bacterium]